AVDTKGMIYVTGKTSSSDFPKKGAYQSTYRGGVTDAFVTKLKPANTGSSDLLYSTFLGAEDEDVGQSIAVDISSNVYVTGYTFSTNFPTSLGAIRTNPPNFFVTAFVTKLNPSVTGTSSRVYSTYLGGNSYENFDG